jgi:cellulose biosynthesis protein BcsQ
VSQRPNPCPPSTGALTDRGIMVADGVLQPVPAGGRSFESFPVDR